MNAQANERALKRAFKWKEEVMAEIANNPDYLTLDAALAQGISLEEIQYFEENDLIVVLNLGQYGKRYPDWQFEFGFFGVPHGLFYGAMRALRGRDQWARLRFFETENPALGGKTPIEFIEGKGDAETLVKAARVWAEGDQGGG